jgi:hypothetical protein
MQQKSLFLHAAIVGALIFAGTASPARGKSPEPETYYSLEETEFFTNLAEEMDLWVHSANERCGTSLVGEYDKRSIRPYLSADENAFRGLSADTRGQCQGVFLALEHICSGSETDKAAVQKAKFHRVLCRMAPKGPLNVTVAGGVITGTIDRSTPASVMVDLATKTLKKNI